MESDFANIRTEFTTRLRARGYPGRWLRSVFEEVDYRTECLCALKPPVFDTDGDDPDVHLLKFTHNLV
jgi:hypothetical protein